MEDLSSARSLLERFNDPATVDVLHRLLDRVQHLEETLRITQEAPQWFATAVDIFDQVCGQAINDGIDIQSRVAGLLKLLLHVTDPKAMRAIESLIPRLLQWEQSGQLLDEIPNIIATVVDVFDEWAVQLKAEGVDLEQSIRRGLHAVLYLGGHIRPAELARIGFLLRSDVMSENSVAAVGMAGSALSSCHQGTCEFPVPGRVGWFGLIRAMGDPNTQRALAFGLQFAKCFGGVLEKKEHVKSPPLQAK